MPTAIMPAKAITPSLESKLSFLGGAADTDLLLSFFTPLQAVAR
jgi:hypothetical protein